MSEARRLWVSAFAFRLTLLAVGFVRLASGQTAKPHPPEFDALPRDPGYTYREVQRQRTLQSLERHRVQVKVPDAVGSNVPIFELARRATSPPPSQAQTQCLAQLREIHFQDFLLAVAAVFTGILVVRKLIMESAGGLKMEFNTSCSSPAAADLSAKVRAEEEAFAEFLAAFRVGPRPPPPTPATVPDSADVVTQEVQVPSARGPQDEGAAAFFAGVPAWLSDLRRLFEQIRKSRDRLQQQSLLGELRDGFGALEGISGLPELLPVWYVASALGGLVRQLEERMNNLTPSTLRTIANGLNVLADLCRPGLRADLCSNPPMRLLVVDGDPISRRAMSHALKRAFSQPDLAEDGEAALNLVWEDTYDAIFLDAMPGVDGLEICSRIHTAAANAATPVVFVTCLDDFDSRASSISTERDDLIAKPFLSFEITVKALTFALRGRLRGCLDAEPHRRAAGELISP